MGTNYNAVWRAGNGEQHWRVGMTADDLKHHDDQHFANGLRLFVLRQSGDSFAAVWRPGGGAQHWRTGMDVDEFKQRDANHFQNGLRIATLHIEGDSYSACWRPGSGAQHWEVGLTFDQFKQHDLQHFNDGLRLLTMMRGWGDDMDEMMGVWRPGSGAQHWFSALGVKIDEFNAEDKKQIKAGLRMTAFPPYELNAIWQTGSGEERIFQDMTLDQFKQNDASAFNDGLRLVDLFVAESI